MDKKSCVLFTELEGIVVKSLVFYITKSTPRPTHLGGKTMDWEEFLMFSHFALYFAINPHNLPNWTRLLTLQYPNRSRNICDKH